MLSWHQCELHGGTPRDGVGEISNGNQRQRRAQ
jgi:hypothetical protein